MARDLLRSFDDFKTRYEELNAQMGDPKILSDAREMKKVGREQSRLGKMLAAMEGYAKTLDAIDEANEIVSSSEDEELIEMAQMELEELIEAEATSQEALKLLLVPMDPDDEKGAIVEIRAGTGGEEAMLFAGDLFRMYSKFAEKRGWPIDIMNSNTTDLGGMKEITFSIEAGGAYGELRFEGGVHRVQRVPATEASGRIHTSAATVTVLPVVEEVEFELKKEDLRIDVFRSSGPGGQSVNTTDSAVRLTHVPTGLVIQCQDERSQLKNKAKAMKVMLAKLQDQDRQEKDKELTAVRRSMVSTGDRSAKIRTYNYPQGRITDHRITLTMYNLNTFVEGEIDEMIEALRMADTEEKLKHGGTV
jgi:peptide chain release factor 1